MRTRLPTMPHDTASRTLARLHIGPDADHGAWSSRRDHPHTQPHSLWTVVSARLSSLMAAHKWMI